MDFNRKTAHIGIIGLGLIGGSMAKALKKYTGHTVYGYDIDDTVIKCALEAGSIDRKIGAEELFACDLIFLGLYPRQAVEFVRKNIDCFQPGSIVIDLCGVKQYLAENLSEICTDHQVLYIGGHPMAGKERWGFSSADADLFRGASMIITPDAQVPQELLGQLEKLFAEIGFGQTTVTTPKAHDSMIAFTSQLAHVVSSAYIKSPRARQHEGFSAGSYKDLTRVAKLNPQMWAELFLENRECLLDEIDTIQEHLREYRDAIAAMDDRRLYELLEEGRKIKEALDQ